jgi:16S rRNA processing protein RimM
MPDQDAPLLHAGRVGAPHGLSGSFRVCQPNVALLMAAETIVVGGVNHRVSARSGHASRLVLHLEGCDDRDAALALRGRDLLVARELAPPLEPDEWWAEDLEGLTVKDGELIVGTVQRLLALPSCEVLEVKRSDPKDGTRPLLLLVPLVSDAVRDVDLEAGVVDIDLDFLGER